MEEVGMSEEEIIKKLTNPKKYTLIEILRKFKREGIENFIITRPEYVQGLLDLYNKEKEKNKKLENADLTTVYMNGFYDGEKKWKDKIKEKIEFYKRYGKIKNSNEYVMSVEIFVLEELLEERN